MVRVLAADRVNRAGSKRTVVFRYADTDGHALPLEVRLVATGAPELVATIVDAIRGEKTARRVA